MIRTLKFFSLAKTSAMLYMYVPKFSPGNIFAFFAPCSHRRNFYPTIFFPFVNFCIEPMVIFNTRANIYSNNISVI